VEALRHHADLQAHKHHRGIGVDRDEPCQDPRQPPITASTTRRRIFAHHGARRRRRRIADLRLQSTRALSSPPFARAPAWTIKATVSHMTGSGCGRRPRCGRRQVRVVRAPRFWWWSSQLWRVPRSRGRWQDNCHPPSGPWRCRRRTV